MSELHWRLLIIAIMSVACTIYWRLKWQSVCDQVFTRDWFKQAMEQLPSAISFIAIFQVLCGAQILPMSLSPTYDTVVRSFGIFCGVYAAVFMVWPHIVRRTTWAGPKTPSEKIPGHFLCTGGPYRYLRHPYYSSVVIGISGVELVMASWLFFLAFAVSLFFASTTAQTEERLLEEDYGDKYRTYCLFTRWRLIPFIY
jgi:protein-S-isoprenylcysteine O-methyltransferase Ste14